VATASTNSRASKRKRRETNGAQGIESSETGASVEAPTAADGGGRLSPLAWRSASASVMLVAVLVRLSQLELRPMHHDEGVNGFFLNNLMRTGIYHYDPSNYHGPTLYYFTLPLAALAERFQMLDSSVVRLIPVIFGLATVYLALSLRRYLGTFGALAAAALLALSPGSVFFSRYFIHEMMFVFFTLAVVVAALRYYETGASEASSASGASSVNQWLEPLILLVALPAIAQYAFDITRFVFNLAGLLSKRPDPNSAFNLPGFLVVFGLVALVALVALYEGKRAVYLILGAVSAALLFATKETAFISLGVLLIAWAMTWGYAALAALAARQGWFGAPQPVAGKRARGKQGGKGSVSAGGAASDTNLRALVERLGGWRRLAVLSVAALGIFFSINILFYSSFFTNPKGVADSLKAFDIWTKTGKSEFHAKPIYMYVQWLFQEESPLILLASAGALIALWQMWRARQSRFALFAALWGFGLLAAYSLINYKTPWLLLSMLIPFALVGGYALGVIYRRGASWRTQTTALLWRVAAFILLGIALFVCACQTYMINFVHYDNDAYIYVYAHTKRSYVDLIKEVERIAARAGGEKKFETPINVAAPEYWPMPWYLRNYKNVAYQGRVIQTTNEALIISSKAQNAEVQATNGTRYQFVKDYEMRPGVILTLYVRRDLAGR
jgi:uncharacterized protein (TIGR03663 family)